ncbi:MAG: LysM peptidoglycan-binding domain-containing protein [Polaribacter sp.]
MIRYLLVLFFSTSIFCQQQKDTIPTIQKDTLFIAKDSIKNPNPTEFFTDSDLKKIDSMLIEEKFSSPLIDALEYIIDDKDIVGNEQLILTTDLLKSRLSKLNADTPFNLEFNPALEKVINSYLRYRKKYYPALMAKARYYFPMFERYLDQYDIPLEMKYLAIVESALKPRARSRVGASGMWQFMYGTGRQFDLKVSSYVDERYNPEKATIAACKYLSQLYKTFGDWDLALAAYNSGPGNVSKAIKRSGGYKNYWNIRPFLPIETAGYVPAFYATLYIFEYADEHKIYPEVPEFFNFQTDTVRIKRTVSFDQISEVLDIDEEKLEALNPSYKLNIIPYVEGRNYAVRLPRTRIIDFLDKEKELYALADAEDQSREKPLPKYFEMDKRISYRVRSGDYLGKIAAKFGVKISQIKRWNRLKSSRLRVGQRLYIFPRKIPASRYQKTSKPKSKTAKTRNTSKKYDIYVVKNGDSLWIIAKKFKNVSVDQIKKWNNIWSAKSLKPGTKLKIYKS